jgi:hypothetical protein
MSAVATKTLSGVGQECVIGPFLDNGTLTLKYPAGGTGTFVLKLSFDGGVTWTEAQTMRRTSVNPTDEVASLAAEDTAYIETIGATHGKCEQTGAGTSTIQLIFSEN